MIFFVNNIENLREKIIQQKEQANQLVDQLPNFINNLQELQKQNY
jgi:uncharacterized coiled-coil protein SlyX